MVSVVEGDVRGDRSFSTRLLEWGNSDRVTLFWAIVGCICSFLSPLCFYRGEGQVAGDFDLSPVRLMIMFLSCVSTAAVYRVGFMLRYHKMMRESLPLLGHLVATLMSAVSFPIGVILAEGGTWATVVGLVLLFVVVFGFMEMAKPVEDCKFLAYLHCVPLVTAIRGYGWDFVYLGWPMLMVVLMAFLIFWNVFFQRIKNPVMARG